MYLMVIPQPEEVYVHHDRAKEESEASEEQRLLEQELARVTGEIGRVTADIFNMETKLQEKFAETSAELDRLDKELKELAREQQEQAVADGWAPKEKPHQNNRGQQSKEEPARQRVEKSAEVKKLFKKISQRTHPDKVDDPVLHELFLEARTCFNKNDLEGLKEVWECVKRKKSRLLSRLLDRLIQLRQQVFNAGLELNQIKGSSSYNMVVDWKKEETRPKVEDFYAQLLMKRIQLIKAEIHRRDPGRYPPPASPMQYTVVFNSTTAISGGSSGWVG